MKKAFKGCLVFILAVLLIYGVVDYFWQRSREKQIEQVIVAMQDSVDELEIFLRENEDDLEYLVTKCVEDDIIIYTDSVYSLRGNDTNGIDVAPEILSRRDRLIANLPDHIEFDYISTSGVKLYKKDAMFWTMHMKISSPPLTEDSIYTAGSIGTVKLNRTWTINVATQDYPDYARARKILKKLVNQASPESTSAG
ncbi:MAG: hypothetical protein HFF10_12175 [Angelakisella sp.]|jgi:hypothetical protein|nr:hypothetical protein [Angelakisella sp.]